MKLSKKLLVLACLLSTTCIPAVQHNHAVKMIRCANSLDQAPQAEELLEKVILDRTPEMEEILRAVFVIIKMSASFERKYGCQPRLRCTTCHQEMIYKFFIGNIVAGTFDESAHPNNIDVAKGLLAHTSDVFANKELDEILEFMEQTANEIQMPCGTHRCPGTHWEVVR